jgi:hypothetical protein
VALLGRVAGRAERCARRLEHLDRRHAAMSIEDRAAAADRLRTELVVILSQLRRLHTVASLGEPLGQLRSGNGVDTSRGRPSYPGAGNPKLDASA